MLEFFKTLSFGNPEFFALLGLIPFLVLWYYRNPGQYEGLFRISETSKKPKKGWKQRLMPSLIFLRILAINLLIFALARPQTTLGQENEETEGIDIVLAMDISPSMLAADFQPDRLEVAKQVAKDFIDLRPSDRFGLVSFAGEAFTQCPLTIDHAVIKSTMENTRVGDLGDRTAIGMGLGKAVTGLVNAGSKSKVVILLTDGDNTAGRIDPIKAGELAATQGVKVYCIGIGKRGKVPYPTRNFNGEVVNRNQYMGFDDKPLKTIARTTRGQYFHATDEKALRLIYQQIDQLERSKIGGKKFKKYRDRYYGFALAALFLILIEILLRNTVFRVIP